MTRRAFIGLLSAAVPIGCVIDAFAVEPTWLAVRKVDLGSNSGCRIVHFSDLHYFGEKTYLGKVIAKINELSADFVCFTGDIVEDARYLEEALDFIKQIQAPVFGVPGNQEYRSGASFETIAAGFEETGGAWLVNEETLSPDGTTVIVGATGEMAGLNLQLEAERRLLLVHYPRYAARQQNGTFDLVLAGHSHGGQVRLPLFGALIVPQGVGGYDRGLYQTPAGPLYVNPGIGTYYFPIRFYCRPEVTLLQM